MAPQNDKSRDQSTAGAMEKLSLVEEWEGTGGCSTSEPLLYTFLSKEPASVVVANVAGGRG